MNEQEPLEGKDLSVEDVIRQTESDCQWDNFLIKVSFRTLAQEIIDLKKDLRCLRIYVEKDKLLKIAIQEQTRELKNGQANQ